MVCKNTITRRRKHQTKRLIRNKPFIEIRESDFAFSAAVVYVHTGETIAAARVKIGVEVHPLTAQGRDSFAMPDKVCETVELIRRIYAVEYAEPF